MRRRVTLGLLLGWLLPTSFAVAHQQAASSTGSGIIAGTLTSADLGRPVRKAQVRITSVTPKQTRSTVTDADGRFQFDGLPAAEYMLSASKAGYLDMTFGALRPGPVAGTPIALADGQRIIDLRFRLPRGGVISGVITDEFGDPAYNVPVRALRFVYQGGRRTATSAGTATTDDLGGYRIAGLPPGDYAVSAVPRDAVATLAATASSVSLANEMRAEQARAANRPAPPLSEAARLAADRSQIPRAGYVTTFYPGAVSPSALGTVRVGLSQQVNAVDVQLQALRTSTLSGVVTKPDGTPTMASVQLMDPAMPIISIGVWTRHATSDGRFSFAGLAPGSYVLRAQATTQLGALGDGELTVEIPVAVADGGDQELAVRLQPGVALSGTVRLDTLPGVDVSKLQMRFRPILGPSDWEMATLDARVDAEGRFSVANVAPARYQVSARGLPEGWAVETAVFDGRDAADVLLEVRGRPPAAGTVTFTNKLAQVAGGITDEKGQPVRQYSVLLFPTDRELWVPDSRRIHVAPPGADGRFTIRNLPPGEYRLAAVVPPDSGQQFDPEFLNQALAASIAVTLTAGEQKTQDIRIR